MKCLICSNEFDDVECPICGFPVVQFPGDINEGLKHLKPTIDKYREELLKKITIGVVLYRWEESGDKLIVAAKYKEPFGCCDGNVGKDMWLKDDFDAVSSQDLLDVTVYAQLADENGVKTFEKDIKVPNLANANTMNIGICVYGDMTLTVKTRSADTVRESERVTLLENWS